MRVEGPDFSPDFAERQHEELNSLVREISTDTRRPCVACDLACSCSASTTCKCDCSPDCAHAPAMMTSDPEFPVESLIAPLVYAFLELRQCPPCWSCEGHLSPDGSLQRPPAIWFYSRSQIFPGMIGDFAASMWAKKILNVPWRISIACTEPEFKVPAYAFQPDLSYVEKPSLPAMQKDIGVLAAGLRDDFQAKAEGLIRKMDIYLGDNSTGKARSA